MLKDLFNNEKKVKEAYAQLEEAYQRLNVAYFEMSCAAKHSFFEKNCFMKSAEKNREDAMKLYNRSLKKYWEA